MAFTRLLFAVALLTCARWATSATRCSDCGTTPVPYPLSTGPNCGDQSYKIQCDAGTLNFNTLNNTYPITSIDPNIQRFVIRPASFLDNNRSCVTADLPTQGVQLNSSLPFNVSSSNTIMYVKVFNITVTILASFLKLYALTFGLIKLLMKFCEYNLIMIELFPTIFKKYSYVLTLELNPPDEIGPK